jgi:ubiquinol-cytochrome c reductase cytochrome c subunit
MTTTPPSDGAPEAQQGATAEANTAGTAGKKTRSRSKLRRRLSGLLALAVALVSAGALYTAFAPTPQTAQADENAAQIKQGEKVYNETCISCHGSNLQGVKDRGPSLIGVGSAAVYFQTSSGRMPLARQEAQAVRKPPKLSDTEVQALMAFVQANGGGPEKPTESGNALMGDDPSRGGHLFRLNCASCHNYTGRGGALSSGKFAPNLDQATTDQVYTAMQSGPQNMPKFSDRQLTPREKHDIIAYVESGQKLNNNPGGEALGGFGPVSEGLIAWIVGIALLVGVTLWIGARA